MVFRRYLLSADLFGNPRCTDDKAKGKDLLIIHNFYKPLYKYGLLKQHCTNKGKYAYNDQYAQMCIDLHRIVINCGKARTLVHKVSRAWQA